MTTDRLQRILAEYFPGARIAIRDLTGTSDHFGVHVVSEAFTDKSLIEQHKMVHAAVGSHLTNSIHALEIKTETP